jgi:hypothetical protein
MKVDYVEGTWFAVPLRGGGFASGLVARATPKGPCVLAYLFGPKRECAPSLADVSSLDASMAILVARIGDLHLVDGTWPLIGNAGVFSRGMWPFPRFVRSDDIRKQAMAIQYSEDDPGREIAREPMAYGTADLDRDSLFGAGTIELVLTKLLGEPDGNG